MELVQFFGADRVITFMLLFARLSGLFVFFPFFSHNQIPLSVRTAFTLVLCVVLLPIATPHDRQINFLLFEILSELLLGFCAGMGLTIVFATLMLVGEQISMVMGFSMATVIDPQTGTNSPIVANILNFMALLTFLMFDGHHLVIQFYSSSLAHVPLGDFYPRSGVMIYTLKVFANLFMFGFILAFPIIALSLLSDLIFGMLMKTMPQFNLLVIGFPIKISISIAIMAAILAGIMKVATELLQNVLNDLPSLFF
ncbi:flagellar type III secretion system protein FliR [Campylobacter sp. faydin G-24]|uniref:Flagellar biosynthetic protein FliR n=1 Tax=Campylobacter anatolicus TaxID=2829105 RepID=A0ABS5HII0_9BACT|nr:flagellar biosynthetic protein FliR [Campylobacter anatolicus]MBR8461671.1 flagellar type III secretion system protein FliR [Campylobacter anatolicus]MBR8463407.1 flagellar type III secretion system protein FliR [Campylobacter anatolicus]